LQTAVPGSRDGCFCLFFRGSGGKKQAAALPAGRNWQTGYYEREIALRALPYVSSCSAPLLAV